MFVGRGAAWVLRRHPRLIRAFLHAPETWRTERIARDYKIGDPAAARELVHRVDQQRAAFMQGLLGRSWTTPDTFDISLDTATVGLDTAVDVIAMLAERMRARGEALAER